MKINSWNLAAIAGLLGGAITIAVYMGVTMAGPLGLVTQVAGALGVIAIVWTAYDYFKKR